MAYSVSLASRVRELVARDRGFLEKRMFGGVGFLLHGNMCVGILQSSLIARIGEAAATTALHREFVRPFDITGRPMKGWVMIEAEGLESDHDLREWVDLSRDFVLTLPRK